MLLLVILLCIAMACAVGNTSISCWTALQVVDTKRSSYRPNFSTKSNGNHQPSQISLAHTHREHNSTAHTNQRQPSKSEPWNHNLDASSLPAGALHTDAHTLYNLQTLSTRHSTLATADLIFQPINEATDYTPNKLSGNKFRADRWNHINQCLKAVSGSHPQ